jgi:cell division protein YceG involved in septum cleavage
VATAIPGAITGNGDSIEFTPGILDISSDVFITGNLVVGGDVDAQNFNQTSDRNKKENFSVVDDRDILQRVANLPISNWNFKTGERTRHIGPMAQDFYAAFNVGTDDKHIATVDEGGVALAAIQGLNEKLKAEDAQKDAQIKALEKRLSDLERLVKTSARK